MRAKILTLITCCCLAFTGITALAQSDCQIQVYSTSNGLPQRNISNIIQDHKGFIWFATWNGLGKFDGYNFKQYKSHLDDQNQVNNNRFNLINVDINNDIWCRAYDSRVYRFDTKTEEFIDPLLEFEKQNKAIYPVKKVYTLSHGATWLIHNNGAFRITNTNNKDEIKYYSPAFGNLPGIDILNIQQDSRGDEWIFTTKGVTIVGKIKIKDTTPYKELCETANYLYLISDNKFASIQKKENKLVKIEIPFKYNIIKSIQNLGNGMIALGKEKGFFIYQENNGKIKEVNLKSLDDLYKYIRYFYVDKHGELWILSGKSGIINYNISTGVERLLQTPANDIPISEKRSRAFIFEDEYGTLWMSPENGCFSYYDRNTQQLKLYNPDNYHINNKYIPLVLSSFYDGNNSFWFSNNRQLNKISFISNAISFEKTDEGFETRAFLNDKSGKFWVASKSGFVRIYNPDNTLMGYLTPEGNISQKAISFNHKIYTFMEDSSGNIWIGSKEDGLFLLKKKSEKSYNIRQFINEPKNSYSLSDNNIYSIIEDSNKRIWIGTHGGGLNLLQKNKKGEIEFLNHYNLLKYPVKKFAKVRIIHEANQAIIVGTTKGLVSFNKEFRDVEKIRFFQNTHKAGDINSLAGNDVMHIMQNSKNKIYIASFSGGINKVLSDNLLSDNIRFKCYSGDDGLQSDLVFSMTEDKKGYLWIVAENALSRFNPENEIIENYDKKHFKRDVNLTEAIPLFRNNKLIIGTDDGFFEANTDLLMKSSYVPKIRFTELSIQGEKRKIAIDDIQELKLKPNERDISVKFTALDYIDPSSIKYAYRIKGLEDKWNESGNNREARFMNLPHGKYQLEVKSTNSDGVWTANIRSLNLYVVPTFWETGWAVLFFILIFILLTSVAVYIFYIIYRLRHSIDIEKQLTNIKLRFFTDISHELRTPLTLITSPLSEVIENETLTKNARKHLEIVQHNSDRMLQLVNQILDFRKIENGKMKLLLEKTEIVSTVKDIMNDFSIMAEKKQIMFTLSNKQEELFAWIDRDKFQKIIINLVSNAFKYTPNGKSITIKISSDDKNFNISIKDEGPGIDSLKIPVIFKRFETIVQQNKLLPSSGIGLSLVRELVELHLGNINVLSQTGEGSEFIINLPIPIEAYENIDYKELILSDDAVSANKVTESDCELNTSTQKVESQGYQNIEGISILIVEDNADLRVFLKDVLGETYNVIEAENGEEGLKKALEFAPDFIISDVSMPVMDGLDMVKAIKEDRNICHIPIILLSAKSSLDDRIAGLEQGIDDYITKPFSSKYLKTRIRLMLQQRKQLQKIYLEQYTEEKSQNIVFNAEPAEPSISNFDQEFMEGIINFIEKNMDNSELIIDDFAKELNMGRTIFYQKMKNITGLSPIDFVLTMRIKRAIQLMKTGKYNFSTIAYMTGFNDPKYFSKCFRKHTGMSPSEYLKQIKSE